MNLIDRQTGYIILFCGKAAACYVSTAAGEQNYAMVYPYFFIEPSRSLHYIFQHSSLIVMKTGILHRGECACVVSSSHVLKSN